MSGTTVENKPEETKSESGWLTRAWNAVRINVGAKLGNEQAIAALEIRNSDTPGDAMLAYASKLEMTQSPEAQKHLKTLTDDKDFMKALNKAMNSDNGILQLFSDNMDVDGKGKANPTALLAQLADNSNRSLLTDVLDKIGESATDKYDAKTLKTVMEQAEKQDYRALRDTTSEMGVKNFRLTLAAEMQGAGMSKEEIANFKNNPMGAFTAMLNKPEKLIGNWVQSSPALSALSPENKEMAASLINGLFKLLKMFMPGMGIIDPYMNLFKNIGARMSADGKNIMEQADKPAAVAAGPQTAPAAEAAKPGAEAAKNEAKTETVSSASPTGKNEGITSNIVLSKIFSGASAELAQTQVAAEFAAERQLSQASKAALPTHAMG